MAQLISFMETICFVTGRRSGLLQGANAGRPSEMMVISCAASAVVPFAIMGKKTTLCQASGKDILSHERILIGQTDLRKKK
ncbi:MAG: hypothetical protein IJZ85_04980 [Lachnospiraceae bacterium]|nr:hypothetical protein [Lachnospiraceae bacterium]